VVYVKVTGLTLPVPLPKEAATAIRQLKALVARSVSQAHKLLVVRVAPAGRDHWNLIGKKNLWK
jgi:hypothetical protein